MEEDEESEDVPPPEETTAAKKGSKKGKKGGREKETEAENREIIQLPPCRHAWCLGEVLKEAGIEPGVCWPRPLPWALTGNLRYLPGWEKQCRKYKLQKVYYHVKPRRVNQDRERFAKEAEEAKLLWSYVEPAILYPRNRTYDDVYPGVVCDCKENSCKRKQEK